MLRALSIHNLLLIDHLDLEFQPGLNVLTGETGAGKSILLDSLGFVLGWRGPTDLVRQGARIGEVSASFDLSADHKAHDILHQAGLPAGDELILRRTNTQDGRKTAFINDRRCSAQVLRQLSDVLIELHGQHDDHGLLNPNGHRALLDAVGKIDTGPVAQAWKNVQDLTAQLRDAQTVLDTGEQERDYLAHAVQEIQHLSPQIGEEAALDTRRRLMQAAGRIRDDIAKAAHAVGPDGADALLSDAARWLADAEPQADDQLGPAIDAVSRTITELGEAQTEIARVLNALNFDPYELEQVEERLFAIRALARKHQVLPDALVELGHDFARQLAALDLGADDIKQLQADLATAQNDFENRASAITQARIDAAKALETAMAGELAPLKLDRAAFMVDIQPAPPNAHGVDALCFQVATNPGAPAGPINKIASGGELSRFLLALKVCLSKRSDGLTLIFDEIDRGVGGATAAAVGARLSAISDKSQTLVVTHSPQVAAKGAHHWRVSKYVQDGQTFSIVQKLDEDHRIDEIARMLADDTITDAARDAARALL